MAPAKRKKTKGPKLDIIEGGQGLPETAVSQVPPHPKGYSRELPVSGAWFPGDPVGRRKFVAITDGRPFALEPGGSLPEVIQAYETWGKLNSGASNAILVCHALTGDSHVSGDSSSSHPTRGWWDEIVGPGKVVDTDEFFVVCINVLGGCQGSTGPASLNPATSRPYGSQFPNITIRDIVRSQAKVADHLGIEKWHAVIGGSMGGMQVLEWAAMFPDRVPRIAPVATALSASAQQIAWSAVGRAALALDPRWREGDYYEAEPGDGPHSGLAIARAIAQIHYRSDESFQQRFGRSLVDKDSLFGLWDRFQVESYLDYHGEKLVRRFDANTYLVLNRAMDTHDLARGRGSMSDAASRIKAQVATASITSDFLYPPHQQIEMQQLIEEAGGKCSYVEIDDPNGHDGFLLATKEIGAVISDLLRN
ncbi:MAG: homoserine O-acetyltransferase [Actinomycetota bacterium]|nr:homoserine O-acetyltransferase [Actinomycetota bacterium]